MGFVGPRLAAQLPDGIRQGSDGVGEIGRQWPRRPPSQRLLKARPTMLVRNGQVRHAALRRARVAESEIRQAARSHGAGELTELAAVVLESDGSLSVIRRDKIGDASSLDDVLDPAG
ncbi:YetF domain-containing protein [Micromonospora sp. DT53]|uniref:YetF domain-containing protein n=1 Tax=Micromonospora sp. DT53 TaxID=3393444 RepID=UPI003CEBCFEB